MKLVDVTPKTITVRIGKGTITFPYEAAIQYFDELDEKSYRTAEEEKAFLFYDRLLNEAALTMHGKRIIDRQNGGYYEKGEGILGL